ncbi:hypothetical protein Z951_15710 [Streptomyces sp. PRh5]|nr:hypothetical protein Z951_15710 [Streptomyces sp. PRh5]
MADAPTFAPGTSSSPCGRRYPQLGFSFARRSTRVRMERTEEMESWNYRRTPTDRARGEAESV